MNEPADVDTTRIGLAWRIGMRLRMQKLVNTLLEFSRIEAGRLEGQFRRVDIATLTMDLASSFRSAIEKAGMQLHVGARRIDGEVFVGCGALGADHSQLGQ